MLHWLTEHIEDAADERFGFLAGERSEPFGGMSAPPSKPLKRLERPWRPFSPG